MANRSSKTKKQQNLEQQNSQGNFDNEVDLFASGDKFIAQQELAAETVTEQVKSEEVEQVSEEFEQTENEVEQVSEEFEQTENEVEQVSEEFEQTENEVEQVSEEFEQTENEVEQVSEEFEQTENEVEPTEDEDEDEDEDEEVEITITAGQILREAREQAQISIDSLSLNLKVNKKAIVELEANNYSKLPNLVFARCLASSICRQLKIDVKDILDRMPLSHINEEVLVDGSKSVEATRPVTIDLAHNSSIYLTGNRKKSKAKWLIISIIIVILVLVYLLMPVAFKSKTLDYINEFQPTPKQQQEVIIPDLQMNKDEAASELEMTPKDDPLVKDFKTGVNNSEEVED